MESYFHDVINGLASLLRADEVYLANFHGEQSDFVRFNHGRVRQAGTVETRSLSVDLVRGRRHAAGHTTLGGDPETDGARVARLVESLRERCAVVPEDPFLLYATEPRSSTRRLESRLLDGSDAVEEIQSAARGRDLVGVYAAGGVYCGFANSLGQRNWYANGSFNLDWSFVHSADKAVATNYAGFQWSHAAFDRKVESALAELELAARPPRTVPPGRYRVYLAPAALVDFLGLLSWGGFGLRAHRSKTTPLLRMREDALRLHREIFLVENSRDGLAPDFQEEGFRRPDQVSLIDAGAYRDCLASPRSAAEYGVPTNGASASEMPQSLDVAPGRIAVGDVLGTLERGIYVGNVWYLNYSDRAACRTTGMTRFATFWVENGKMQAPLNVMRFDETIYRMLGENLVGLTDTQEWILDASTYSQRSTASTRLPGALVDDFTLTL
jgi:predicted Zn-dependent protease